MQRHRVIAHLRGGGGDALGKFRAGSTAFPAGGYLPEISSTAIQTGRQVMTTVDVGNEGQEVHAANGSITLTSDASISLPPDQIAYCYPVSMRPVKEIRRTKLAQLENEVGSRTELANRIGKDRAQIYQWLLDPGSDKAPNSKRGISDKVARQIEETFGLPRGWMDFDEPRALHLVEAPVPVVSAAGAVSVPFLADYIEPGGAHQVMFPRSLLRTRPDLLEPQIKVAWKEADDMRGEIEVGDLVFVDTSVVASPPRHDGVYAVRLGKQLFIKKVRSLGNGGYRLQGSKPTHDAIDLFENDLKGLIVLGRVVAKLTGPTQM